MDIGRTAMATTIRGRLRTSCPRSFWGTGDVPDQRSAVKVMLRLS